ncbi:MAG: phage holin family protein [Sphingomonadaceae bacterium]|nr:phage holin family protein [Sphingomonadaceae bacterium]
MDQLQPADPEPPRPTLPELLARVVDEGEDFIRAEVGLYRAQAGRKLLDARWAVALLGGAIVLAQGATIALLVGLIMALTPRIGPAWATLVVIGVTLAIVALLVKVGLTRLSEVLKLDKDA